MPYLHKSSYVPPTIAMRNGHWNTVYPYFFRKFPQLAPYQRERLFTPDHDFIDLDWARVGSRSLIIALHGLEGSSDSQYIKGIRILANQCGWDMVGFNQRSCSGEINQAPRIYHMGATDDLEFVVQSILAREAYDAVVLAGYSLGGNIALRYLGEQSKELPAQVKGATVFSVPIDMKTANVAMHSGLNYLYVLNFLKTLHPKAVEKAAQYPDMLQLPENFKPRSFLEYDTHVTAPLHGYESAEEYWEKSSCKPVLPDIKVPVLLVNARDDGFLSEACYPKEMAETLDHFYLEIPKYGGHCGFCSPKTQVTWWMEHRAFEFINEVLK